jgi:molecular chaperone IbpA
MIFYSALLKEINMKISFGNLYPFTLGFETALRDIEAQMENSIESLHEKFPPHNIIKHNETSYSVELAVAGFNQSDIHKGISNRSFTKTIRLADTIEVKGADLESGVLKISLENIIPESKKPKKIEINGIKNLASQQVNSLTA